VGTYTATLVNVPNKPATKHRQVRLDDDLWKDLGVVARNLDTDRSTIIREFVKWFLRRRGAQLPERPPASPSAHDSG
jgi:hypothetical protein